MMTSDSHTSIPDDNTQLQLDALRQRVAELEQALAERDQQIADLQSGQHDAQATAQATQASEDIFRAFFEQSQDGLILVDDQGIILDWSQGAEHIFGLSRAEAIGLPRWDVLFQFVPEHKRTPEIYELLKENTYQFIDQARRYEKSWSGERYQRDMLCVDGNKRVVSSHVFPIYTGNQLLIGGIVRDISERIQYEAALRVSDEHSTIVLERITDAFFALDTSFRFTYLNQRAALLLQRSQDELLGKNIWEEFPEAVTLTFYEQYHQAMEQQVTVEFEAYFPPLATWFEVHTYPSDNGLSVYFQDVTRRRQAEEALKDSEARYRLLADNASDMISLYTPEGECTYVSPACRSLLGFEPDDLLGHSAYELFHPDDLPAIQLSHQTILAEPIVYTVGYRIRHKAGHYIWFETTSRTVRDPVSDAVEEIIAVSRDISDRKQVEHALRRSEETFRTLVDSMEDIVFTLDPQQRHTGVYGHWVERYGLTPEMFLGKTPREVIGDGPLADIHETFNARALAGELVTYVWFSGEPPIYVQTSLSPIREPEGDIIGLVGEGRDITVLKETELALQKARDEAEAANVAKSTFLANMSHELRTPLNAILGFTQLLERDSRFPPDLRHNLNVIGQSGEHLLALINDILDLSKIEAGQTQLQEQPFDLDILIRDLHSMFQLRANEKGLQLAIDPALDMPTMVRGDERKLRQVLLNLLSNAIKFTDQGGVTLRVSSKNIPPEQETVAEQTHPPDTRLLYFEVEDTGIGIAPESLESIFDAFAQVPEKTRIQEGTGLGLPISQHFVRIMGGELQVLSQPGQGSRFIFTVPMQTAETEDRQPRAARQQVIGLEADQPTYRILVVEDRLESRLLLVQLLRPLGFAVSEAVNGQEAVDLCESWEPHLIFMDMRMPVLDGYEATRQIRSSIRGQAPAIVALTASAFEEERNLILSAGCNAFIRKPFRAHEIFDVLKRLLGVRFVYATNDDKQADQPAKQQTSAKADSLTAEVVATLPTEWVAQVHRAALLGNGRLIERLAAQIDEQYPQLAAELQALAEDFAFDHIALLTDLDTN